MFDFLKKKIASWVGTDKPKEKDSKAKKDKKGKKETKPSKEAKKKVEVKQSKEKKETKKEVNEEKVKAKPTVKEKIQENIQKKEVEQVEKKEPEVKEEVKQEKKGFFSKLFSNKEKAKEEPKTEEGEESEVEEVVEEDSDEEEQEELEDEKKEEKPNFFSKLLNKITKSEITKEDFSDAFEDLEITLLENNVALEAVDKIRETLEKKLVGQLTNNKGEAKTIILDSLKESIISVLQEPPNFIEEIKKSEGVYTAIFFGINGTGKTTSIAKIAHLLKQNNITCVLAAADTFRAASIEQLKVHADRVGVPIISSGYGADPTSVIFEARKYAKLHNIKVVLADTAGRMYTKENLIKEMEKIIRVNQPNLKIFVGESITGNDAIEQAKTFNEAIGIDGIILSKADIDPKAGTILSVSHITNKPIYFLGTGQEYKDLTVFSKKEVLKNLGLED